MGATGVSRIFDGVLFSGLVPAAVAASLSLAAAAAMGVAADAGLVPAAAFFGALTVYVIDRVRDRERDRASWPERTAFVSRHARSLHTVAAVSAALSVGLVAPLGLAAWGLCAGVLLLGLLHRRLKRTPPLKITYVTLSWVAITVGLPAVAGGAELAKAVPVGLVYGGVIAANLTASATAAARRGDARMRWARGLAIGAGAIALLYPGGEPALFWIPLAELAALGVVRGSERDLLAGLDGALLVGAVLAWASS